MTIYVIGATGIRPDNPPDGVVYVDHRMRGWPDSPLRNQIPIIRPEWRTRALKEYKEWLWAEMQDISSPQRKELERIAEKAKAGPVLITSWDREPDGHAHIVKRAVEYILNQEPDSPHE